MPPWLPSRRVVADLFPARGPLAQAAIMSQSVLTRAANAVLRRLLTRVDRRRMIPIVRDAVGADALRAARDAGRPVVLVAWHAGLVAGLGVALAALGIQALVLRHEGGDEGDTSLTHVTTRGAPALALHRAIKHARDGGVVLVVLDVITGWAAHKPGKLSLLGHAVKVPRGAAAIARLGRADILCVMPRLSGRGLELVVSSPLPRESDDAAQMRHIVAWWQAWFEAHPGDLWPESARAIAQFPYRTRAQ